MIYAETNFNYYTLTAEDGLPSETVWVSLQDTLGYLWFGTANGLCRYDGKTIEVFKKKDGLCGNSITSLNLDNYNNIIVGCYKEGINKISYTGESNLLFQEIETKRIINWDVFVEDSICMYYVPNHIVKLNTISYIEKISPLKIMHPRLRIIDKNNFLTLEKNVLHVFDKNLNLKKELELKGNFRNLQIVKDSLYLLNDKKLIKLHKYDFNKIDTLYNGLHINNDVSDFYICNENEFFANVVDKGLYYFDAKKSKVNLEFMGATFESDSSNVCDFMQINEGSYVFSTMENGVVIANKHNIKNLKFSENQEIKNISNITYDSHSDMYIISNKSNLLFVKDNETKKYFKNNHSFLSFYILTILNNQKGEVVVWQKENINSRKVENTNFNFVFADVGLYGNNLDSLIVFAKRKPINSKTLFYRTCSIDSVRTITGERNNAFKEVRLLNGIDNRLSLKVVYVNNSIVIIYSEKTLKFIKLSRDAQEIVLKDKNNYISTKIKDNRVFDIKVDVFQNIWFATDDGLVAYIDSVWHEFNDINFVSENSFRAITFDNQNNIWFATLNGLVYYDRKNFYQFKKSVGFLSNQLDKISCNTSKNELLVSSNKGVSFIPIEELLISVKNEIKIPLRINKVFSNQNSFNPYEPIKLKPKENFLTIEIDLLSFTNPKDLFLQYQFNDNNWETTFQDVIELKNLASGNHIIKLKAGYHLTNMTEIKTFQFYKLAPIYQRKWFIALIALSFIAATILIARFQINKNKINAAKELAVQQKINTLEQKALGVAMKPHFVFNVLNSVSAFSNQNKLDDVNNYLSKFASLIRKNFEVMGEDLVSLDDELERLIIYLDLELLRFENKFSYKISYNKDSDFEAIYIPSLILQPFVENSIWHGKLDKNNGNIIVEIKEEDPYLLVSIKDNGIGVDNSLKDKKNNSHESKGIKITKERIKLFGLNYNLNSSVTIKQTNPQGTLVEIKMPLIEKS